MDGEQDEARRKQKKILLFVGLGCLGVAILGCIGAAAGTYACASGLMKQTEVVDTFFAEVRAGQYEQAYGRMSESYRSSYDQAAFVAAVQKAPLLTQQTSVSINQFQTVNGLTVVRGQASTPRGTMPVIVEVASESGGWAIAKVTIGDQTFP